MTVLLSTVPGLAAASEIMREINNLVENVSVRKSECKALAVQASAAIKEIEEMSNIANDAQLKESALSLEKALSGIRTEIQLWSTSHVRVLFKYWKIPNRIRFHELSLNKALAITQGKRTDVPLKPLARSTWPHGGGEILPLMTLSKRLSVAVFPCPTQDLPGIFVSKSGMGLHARGGWSDVWRGELHDENNGTIEAVAVKILLGIDMGYGPEAEALQSERLQKRLHREVHAWHGLSHPSIVPLRGFALDSNGTPWLVSPWFSNGDVISHVQRHPFTDKWKVVRQVAEGVRYLHSQHIVHGDLKSNNVLIDSNGDAALCDFGLSKRYEDCTEAYLTINVVTGAARWCAPEILDDPRTNRTEASDVYAFASLSLQVSPVYGYLTLSSSLERELTKPNLEIITGHYPFRHLSEGHAHTAILNGVFSQREDYPELPAACRFWDILEACWDFQPSKRPKMSDLMPETFNENM